MIINIINYRGREREGGGEGGKKEQLSHSFAVWIMKIKNVLEFFAFIIIDIDQYRY